MNDIAHHLWKLLPDLADELSHRLQSLQLDPSPETCDGMMRELSAAQVVIARLKAELLLPEEPTV